MWFNLKVRGLILTHWFVPQQWNWMDKWKSVIIKELIFICYHGLTFNCVIENSK